MRLFYPFTTQQEKKKEERKEKEKQPTYRLVSVTLLFNLNHCNCFFFLKRKTEENHHGWRYKSEENHRTFNIENVLFFIVMIFNVHFSPSLFPIFHIHRPLPFQFSPSSKCSVSPHFHLPPHLLFPNLRLPVSPITSFPISSFLCFCFLSFHSLFLNLLGLRGENRNLHFPIQWISPDCRKISYPWSSECNTFY